LPRQFLGTIFYLFLMANSFAITIIFIALAGFIAAFIRKRARDKCLKDFQRNMVTLEKTSGKIVWGRLNVENTGLEFVYPNMHRDEDGHDETSFVLYKYEYPDIQAMVRFHDELSEGNKRQREIELKRAYHPTTLRRLKRKTINVFKAVRDSVIELLNILISQARKATPAKGVLTSQDKYVSQMKQELVGSVGTSYEPLLEKYIGKKVVLELIKGDKIFEYCGVLKEYTANFIEIMDVDYKVNHDQPPRKADLVVLRKYGVVRHLGE